jgi:hypothetical protein
LPLGQFIDVILGQIKAEIMPELKKIYIKEFNRLYRGQGIMPLGH